MGKDIITWYKCNKPPVADSKELSRLELTTIYNNIDGSMDYWEGWAFYKEPQPEVNRTITIEDGNRIGKAFVKKKLINEKGVYYIEFVMSGELKDKTIQI